MRRAPLLPLLALLGLAVSCGHHDTPGAHGSGAAATGRHGRLVILGFDGVDPRWLERWVHEGKLPHLGALMQAQGGHGYAHLASTNPPQSPVAWTTFATGTPPGEHGIYDFIRRRLAAPGSQTAAVIPQPGTTRFEVREVGPPVATNLRTGIPFWKTLADDGVRTVALDVPYSFPPDPMRDGRMLSGLGVPDVRGTNSTFTYAGTDVTEHRDLSGGSEEPLTGGHFALLGPSLPQGTEHRSTSIDVTVRAVDATHLGVKLGDAAEVSLPVGVESDVLRVVFDPQGAGVHAVLTLTALEAQPRQRLFVSPIGMDPRAQWSPIAYPQRFAEVLETDVGRTYKTVGWDHDTSALNTEVIDDGQFLAQMDRIETDRQRMLLARLGHDDWDLLIWVSTATDRAAHMFYRLMDPQHPRYDAALAARYGDAVERQYRRMDETVGRVLSQLHQDDTLLVISDHGFHDYRRGLHVNQWLRQQGLLFLRNDAEASDTPYLLPIDWSRTKAYSLGTGQIYLNLRGRERDGIVNTEDGPAILAQIRDGLLAVRDTEKENARVISEVYLGTDVFQGGRHADAPDLQIAFAENYRTSWETTLGGVPAGLFADNTQKWSGDHASSDVRETPGVLISNRPVARQDPAIVDLAPTATRFFGRPVPARYTGHDFLNR